MRFEPAGMTDDKDVRIAQSSVDYLFRRLAIDYLDVETRQALGIKTTAERTAEVNGPAEPGRARAPAASAAPVPVEPQQRPAATTPTAGSAPAAVPPAPASARAWPR